MDLKDLKKQYDSEKIGAVEKEIKTHNELSLEARKVAIFALRYLEKTGRYKENPVYRKSNFENYLVGQFNIRDRTYRESLRAFTCFEDASVKYGVGLISKVFRKCGVKKERQVIEEIQKADKALKTPIQKAKIESIIQKHAKPIPPAKPGYKELYATEKRQHKAVKERYVIAIQELKEAREQIEKLKATVLELRPLRDMRAAIMPFIVPKRKAEPRAS